MSNPIVQRIELDEVADLKRTYAGVNTTDDDTIYYYKLGKKLGFVNGIGAALTTSTTITFWYYRTPLASGTEDLSDSVVPIVDPRWDDAIVFGTCFNITGDLKWKALFEAEMESIKTHQNIQNNHILEIRPNREYD